MEEIIKEFDEYCKREVSAAADIKSNGTISSVSAAFNKKGNMVKERNELFTYHINRLLDGYDGNDGEVLKIKLVEIAKKHILSILI